MGELNDQLAEVLALQKADEGLWRVLQAEDDVLADLDLAFLHPLSHRACKLAPARPVVVEDDEALHPDALAQQRAHQQAQPVGSRWQLEHGAAYVFEVDVDALRARCGQVAGQVVGAVIDAEVEAQFVDDVSALVWSASL